MATKTKARKKNGQSFRVPMGYEPRKPNGLSPLAEFIASCEDEVEVIDAVREYQQEWCEHPKKLQRLHATISEPLADRFEYVQECGECGLLKTKQGKVPTWLRRN